MMSWHKLSTIVHLQQGEAYWL